MTQKFYFKVRYSVPDSAQSNRQKLAHDLYNYAHGPFDDMDEVKADIAAGYPDKGDRFLVVDGELIAPPVNPRELPEDQKRAPGDERNWRKVPGNGDKYKWVCKFCSEDILEATVAHPIHFAGLGGGGGECRYEKVGYCPNCERKPDFHGTPVEVWL